MNRAAYSHRRWFCHKSGGDGQEALELLRHLRAPVPSIVCNTTAHTHWTHVCMHDGHAQWQPGLHIVRSQLVERDALASAARCALLAARLMKEPTRLWALACAAPGAQVSHSQRHDVCYSCPHPKWLPMGMLLDLYGALLCSCVENHVSISYCRIYFVSMRGSVVWGGWWGRNDANQKSERHSHSLTIMQLSL